MNRATMTTMQRLGADDYYEAALAILGESGSDALTINALCQRLGITKGSFYHHFGAMPAFVTGLLDYWQREHGDRLTALARAAGNPEQRLGLVLDGAADLPHASEAALRAWGTSQAEVADAVEQVDKRREKALTDAIVASGVARPRARLLGRMGMNLLVGAQARERAVEVRRLRQTFDELGALIRLEAGG